MAEAANCSRVFVWDDAGDKNVRDLWRAHLKDHPHKPRGWVPRFEVLALRSTETELRVSADLSKFLLGLRSDKIIVEDDSRGISSDSKAFADAVAEVIQNAHNLGRPASVVNKSTATARKAKKIGVRALWQSRGMRAEFLAQRSIWRDPDYKSDPQAQAAMCAELQEVSTPTLRRTFGPRRKNTKG